MKPSSKSYTATDFKSFIETQRFFFPGKTSRSDKRFQIFDELWSLKADQCFSKNPDWYSSSESTFDEFSTCLLSSELWIKKRNEVEHWSEEIFFTNCSEKTRKKTRVRSLWQTSISLLVNNDLRENPSSLNGKQSLISLISELCKNSELKKFLKIDRWSIRNEANCWIWTIE